MDVCSAIPTTWASSTDYRDDIYFNATVELELPFSKAEFSHRLRHVRSTMAAAKIDGL